MKNADLLKQPRLDMDPPSPAIRDEILQSLSIGVSLDSAAVLAGVTPELVFAWMQRGALEDPSAFADFLRAVRLAEARFERSMVLNLATAAAAGKWQAAHALLNRKTAHRALVMVDLDMIEEPAPNQIEVGDIPRLLGEVPVFGFDEPLPAMLVNGKYRVLKGFTELAVARLLGITSVPLLIEPRKESRNG